MGLPQCNEVSNYTYVISISMIVAPFASSPAAQMQQGISGGFCVDLSLTIVMLSARHAWASHLGPHYLWQPPQTFPHWGPCCGWTCP